MLVATWAAGVGDCAFDVVAMPSATSADAGLRLARTLSFLSSAAWRTYPHPGSGEATFTEDAEGWRRDQERAALDDVVDALASPNLPKDGQVTQSYSRVIESANQVGRELHSIGVVAFTFMVIDDVRAELAAIEQAGRGDLGGRARQAVLLSRADASPVQVAAADALLRTDPFGSRELFTDVDPTAAAVAAVHWLEAAAMTAQAAGVRAGRTRTLSEIVLEADDMEALPVATPALVLDRIEAGFSAHSIVCDLIEGAMAVARGEWPGEVTIDSIELEGSLPARTTPLDPSRPALDLLEDLLSGIHGAWLIYEAYVERFGPKVRSAFLKDVRRRATQR